MKKNSPLFLALAIVLLIASCAPTTSTPAPTAQPLNLDAIPAGESFAGLLQGNVPFNITWYSLGSVPLNSGITASPRPDGGIDLRVDGIAMPIWDSGNGNFVMSNGWTASDVIDFASGSMGTAGFKDGVVAYIRQIDEQWQVGLMQK